ncbi:MAG: hypothetical protein HUU17_02485 [Chthonomonadales bacterium]|nr:hypothetical protein [Chthonomonadales bacterium]
MQHPASTVTLLMVLLLSVPGWGQRDGSPVPPSERAQKLQLNKPFTLVYGVKARTMDEGEFRPYRFRLTLSYDGKKLLYRRFDYSTGLTPIELYDGKETYEPEIGSRIAMISRGFDPQWMWLCPLPGVGVPNIPMFTFGIPSWYNPETDKNLAPQLASLSRYVSPELYNVPKLQREYGIWHYDGRETRSTSFNHVVVAAGIPSNGTLKTLWYATLRNPAASPADLWEYSKHRRFAGVWLAGKIWLRTYGKRTKDGPNTLVREANYTLEEALERALEPSAFDPTTYLPKHANVTDRGGPTVRTFIYEPGQGTLEEQRSRGMEVTEQAAKAARPPVNTGFVGLGLLAAAGGVWAIWRKRRMA